MKLIEKIKLITQTLMCGCDSCIWFWYVSFISKCPSQCTRTRTNEIAETLEEITTYELPDFERQIIRHLLIVKVMCKLYLQYNN